LVSFNAFAIVGRGVAIAVKSKALRKTETIIATKHIQKARVLGVDFVFICASSSPEFPGGDSSKGFDPKACVGWVWMVDIVIEGMAHHFACSLERFN
jgi:hypothetical protein